MYHAVTSVSTLLREMYCNFEKYIKLVMLLTSTSHEGSCYFSATDESVSNKERKPLSVLRAIDYHYIHTGLHFLENWLAYR